MTYRLTASDDVVIDAAGRFIPCDPLNRDWQTYEAWRGEGHTPDPFVAPPAPTPAEISRRQFFQQLAHQGAISQAEALGAVKTGNLPAALAAFVATLPADDRFAAEMLLGGAAQFMRSHPLTAAIGAAQGMSAAQIDDFFRAAAAL